MLTQDAGVRRPARRRALATLGTVVAAGLGAAAVALVRSPGADEGRFAEDPVPTEVHRHAVATPRTAAVRGGPGRVRLEVLSEGTPPTGPLPASIVAGDPVTLSFTLTGARPPASPPILRATRAGASGSVAVSLASAEAVLVSRAGGEVVGAAAPGSAEPGHHLARVAGASDRWAAKLTPGAAAIVADPTRGLLAAAYPDAGRVETVDLVARRRGATLQLGGSPDSLAAEPGGGRLWVGDAAAGRVRVMDPVGGGELAALEVGKGPHAVAFARGAGRALVIARGSRTAMLVDLSTLRTVSSTRLAEEPSSVAFGTGSHAFAVVHPTGTMTLLRLDGGRLAPPRTLRVSKPGAGALAVSPDGRTAAIANRATGTLVLVDLVTGRLIRTVEAGPEPADVVFLDHFALAPSARTGSVTWVDTQDPRRSNDLLLGDAPASGIALSGDGSAALAPVPSEKIAYRIHVMMGRPMVMDRVPSTFAADTAIGLAGGLREAGPGAYELRTALESPGRYRLELALAGGARARLDLTATATRPGAARVRPLASSIASRAGRPVTVRFRVTRARPATATVLAYSLDARRGVRQLRVPARHVGSGVYVARLVPPAVGAYRLQLISEEAGIGPDSGPAAVLQVAGN